MRMIRFLLPLCLVAGCAAPGKEPPTDDPDVDDAKADSLRYPTMGPALVGDNSLVSGAFTASKKYLGYPITLQDGQGITVWAGGADAAGGTLDTVAYLYGPKDAHGRRGSYLARNDDRSDDSYASRFDVDANAGPGEYLVVVTTYDKPDPGALILVTEKSGRTPLPPPAGPHAPPLYATPLVDPELVAAVSVDDILNLLDRDVAEGDPLTIASDVSSLWGGRKWPLDIVGRVDQAVHAALPTPTAFGQWPERAQAILLTTDRVFVPVTTTKKPNLDAVVETLLASAPGFALKEAFPTALGYGGKLYGFTVDVVMTDDHGSQFTSHEWFGRAGNYLGSTGGDYDDED
jgi:hypothetical protein